MYAIAGFCLCLRVFDCKQGERSEGRGAGRVVAALRNTGVIGRASRSAGPPQARLAPSGGSEPHEVGSVAAYFVAAINLMLRDLWPEPLTLLTVDATTVETMVGKGSENLVRSVLNHAQAQVKRAQRAIDLIAKYDQAFARYQHHYQAVSGLYSSVYPGVPEGLDSKSRVRSCIHTYATPFSQPDSQSHSE